MKKKFYKMLCVLTAAVFCMTAPAVVQAAQNEKQTEAAQEEEIKDREIAQELAGMKYDHSLELQYADQFAVDYYEGGYALITIAGDERFLLVPEDKEAPEGLDADISVIQKPVQNIYLVATSAMDLFCALDGLDSISLSGTNADGWYIDKAKKAMEDGDIAFAGKYSAPDYELILSKNCDLAIESTMIYHQPEVQEKLEKFGIPVLVEHSSYESHPLGRTEWIKLYGVLLGKEDQAQKLFQEQVDKLKSVEDSENTGKTVAFFYINSMGAANVRKSNDYVSKMIELAGGEYIFHDPAEDDNALSTMNMQMEEFYAKAKDADYIIYNSTIDGELDSIDELLAKSSLLADFKAVKDGNVWCTGKNLFQETMGLATMIEDIHTMLTSDDPKLDSLTYMKGKNMRKKLHFRYWLSFIILIILLGVLVFWNINSGSIPISLQDVFRIIFLRDGTETAYNIIWEIRLPRILAAVILGGALSVSGFLLQTFFGNPIAGPFVLGISSGAKLIVALTMIFLLGKSIVATSGVMIIAAFTGSMISMGFVLLIAKKVNQMSMLVISGIMIGYICSAVTDFVVTFADDSNIVNLHNWSMGSFSGTTWENVSTMTVVVMTALIITFLMSKPIGAYQLGEGYAQNMGVNIKAFRIALILLSSILSACVTAFAGPISFVGIAVPHLVKSLLKTSKPLLVIPACFLGGAVFCLFCDMIARTVFAPTELSISSVTAVFGAPIVIYIMIHRKKRA